MELKVQNVSKTYKSPQKIVEASKNLNFQAKDGEVIGLVGANGAGKTTLIKMICNLVHPTKGAIYIDGKNVRNYKKIVEQNVGVVLEGARNVYNFLSVQENLEYFSYLNGLSKKEMKAKNDELLEMFALEDKRKAIVNELSRGMQQKVAIMIALIKNPSILILDEPTLGLDIVGQLKMREVILNLAKKENRLVFVCSHDMELIKTVCTRALCFRGGSIVNDISLESSGFCDLDSEELVVYVSNSEQIRGLVKKHDLGEVNEDGDVIEIATKKTIEELLSHIDGSKIIKMEKRNSSLEEYLREIEEKEYDNKKSTKS